MTDPGYMDDDPGYREPPHNHEAEQAVIGCLMMQNDTAPILGGMLTADDFFFPVHRDLYAAAMAMIQQGRLASPVTMRADFEGHDGLKDVGGAKYLARLAGAAATLRTAQHYAIEVRELAERRALIELARDMIERASGSRAEDTSTDIIGDAQTRMAELGRGQNDREARTYAEIIRSTLDNIDAAQRGDTRKITTGLEPLDRILSGGMAPGNLILLAGRPAMGKTALAMQIASDAARAWSAGDERRGAGVLIFSLEMEAEELVTRQLSAAAEIDSSALARGDITMAQYEALDRAGKALATLPLHIRDTAARTIEQIRQSAFQAKHEHDVGLIVVDHIGRVRRDRRRNDTSEIGYIAQALKNLAKELRVPVLALNQLSRAVEGRDVKRPMLADLRDSGELEQEADIVAFVYRDEYYVDRAKPEHNAKGYDEWLERKNKSAGRAEIIIAKMRGGRTGAVNLFFDGPTTRFTTQRADPFAQDTMEI